MNLVFSQLIFCMFYVGSLQREFVMKFVTLKFNIFPHQTTCSTSASFRWHSCTRQPLSSFLSFCICLSFAVPLSLAHKHIPCVFSGISFFLKFFFLNAVCLYRNVLYNMCIHSLQRVLT